MKRLRGFLEKRLSVWTTADGTVTIRLQWPDAQMAYRLVDAAEQLARDFDLPVEFVCGSFIPKGAQVVPEADNGFAWLVTDKGNTEEELGLDTDDFGVIFAYPWPDEERLIGNLFERYAAVGAVLVAHHGGQEFRLRRKP